MRDLPRNSRAALLALALCRLDGDRVDDDDWRALWDAFERSMPIYRRRFFL